MIGIIGGGQLGRMLASAAAPLNLRCLCVDPAKDCPAAWVAEQIVAPFDDDKALCSLNESCSIITFEFENVNLEVIANAIAPEKLRPSLQAVQATQDRLLEKQLFERLNIATPRYRAVSGTRDEMKRGLEAASDEIGFPMIVKTRRFGYDGKGQEVIRSRNDIPAALDSLGEVALIAEQFLSFDREISIVATRGSDGQIVFYPAVQNIHRQGILRLSFAPACGPDDTTQKQASTLARKVLEALDYCGTCAIELFQCGDQLLGNEIAPRVHNSGHWTIEGAETSQFENHIRAITGAPLGSTAPRGYAAMINLIGTPPPTSTLLSIPGGHLHLYGKTPRPGRKLGHLTFVDTSRSQLITRLQDVANRNPELLTGIELANL